MIPTEWVGVQGSSVFVALPLRVNQDPGGDRARLVRGGLQEKAKWDQWYECHCYTAVLHSSCSHVLMEEFLFLQGPPGQSGEPGAAASSNHHFIMFVSRYSHNV